MRVMLFKMVSDPKCYNPRILKSLTGQIQNISLKKQNYYPGLKSSPSLQHNEHHRQQQHHHQQQEQRPEQQVDHKSSDGADPMRVSKPLGEANKPLLTPSRSSQQLVV